MGTERKKLSGPPWGEKAGHERNELGEQLRKLREEMGLTQPELADNIGIDKAHLFRIENGRVRPSPRVTCRIADTLEISAFDLLIAFGHYQRPARHEDYEAVKRMVDGGILRPT